jgi:endonuclease/exonuclease/phosphatase family metal-dependent hydrolase
MARISVATINLRNRQDRWLKRRELLVAQLLDVQPDLVSLQEIYRPISQGSWLKNQLNTRLSGSSKHPYQLVQKRKHHPIHGYFEGIGVLSKLPVLAQDAVSLGYGGRVALRVNVELPSRESLDFVAVHLHHIAHDRQARVEQVMRLSGWLNDRNPVPLQVIAGDFNELPDGLAIKQMKQVYRSAFVEAWGHEPLATFPTALIQPLFDWSGCLDYVFISKGVGEVLESLIFCDKPAADDPTLYPSDHVGLLVALDVG